jgi:hypothetical protein
VALAIDGSTPAVATQATGSVATVTTASFTPPAGAVLLVMYSANTIDPNDPGNPTITDNLGVHLTYTSWDIGKRPDSPLAEGQVATWTAVVGASAAMTITVTNGAASPNRHAALTVQVLTGADTTTPVGAHGKSSSIVSASSIAQNYTASATSGWGFLVACDWFDAGAETAGTGCTLIGSADIGGQYTYAFIRRTTADDSNGVTNTLRATLPGGSTSLRWAWIEILPATVAAGGRAAPIVSAGQQRQQLGYAITFDHGTVVQAPASDVPGVLVQPSHGISPRRTGTTLVITPRAEPSPAQNQPVPFVDVVTPPRPATAGAAQIVATRSDPAPAVAAGRPGLSAGSSWTTGSHADPVVASDPPVTVPAAAAGRPPAASGSSWTAAPKTAPDPSQNQPVIEPVVSSGRGPLAAGAAVTTASRTDPSVTDTQPVIEPAMSAGVRLAPVGAAVVTAIRAEPTAVVDTPPVVGPVVLVGRPVSPPGQAWTSVPRTDPVTDQKPTPTVVVGAYARAAAGAGSATVPRSAAAADRIPAAVLTTTVRTTQTGGALLTRSTFTTPPPVAFIHPSATAPGVRLPSIGSAIVTRLTEFTGHFCPPPTPRPDTGITSQPTSGATTYLEILTARPDNGITVRPDTGETTVC